MQLLVIRHALPLRSERGQGSDPDLSPEGVRQAARLPDALARFSISRVVSSPQRRARQTAEPVARALGLPVDVDDRLAEYDRDLSEYVPAEEMSREEIQRLMSGQLPSGVDTAAFLERIAAGVADIVAAAEHHETVALFSHGGVINGLVHQIMRTERLLSVGVDYAGITRLLASREGRLGVAAINATEHVWDLLPRNAGW